MFGGHRGKGKPLRKKIFCRRADSLPPPLEHKSLKRRADTIRRLSQSRRMPQMRARFLGVVRSKIRFDVRLAEEMYRMIHRARNGNDPFSC